MKAVRSAVIAGLLVLTLTAVAIAGPEPRLGPLGQTQKGELFCPPTALALGNHVIKSGSCYVPITWQTASGAFSTVVPLGTAFDPCQTILNSLFADWQATRALFASYGPQMEVNPVIRMIGPDLYFATWSFGVAAICKENNFWQMASIVIWVVETYAVNTHTPLGTAQSAPLLMFVVRF